MSYTNIIQVLENFTQHALVCGTSEVSWRLHGKITKGFNSGLLNRMVVIDLQKVFDTIDHNILVLKMPFMGFTDEKIKWYTSYLSNAKFIIIMENAKSDKPSITCGVPQGSILGPLLFLIYINGMPQAVDSEFLLFADDTCLVFQHMNIKTIEEHLNRDFSTLVDCFVDNKVSVHFGEDKTKSIPFSPKHRSKSILQKYISNNDVKIKQQYSKAAKVAYGCVLDECITGECMAMQVCIKVTSKLIFLYRNRFLSKDLRRLLCNTLIQPHCNYACVAWYPNSNKYKIKLQILQGKYICFCLQMDNREHIETECFDKINWLPLDQRFKQCLSASIFKFLSEMCPQYMNGIYATNQSNFVTRSSSLKLFQQLRTKPIWVRNVCCL